VVGTQFHHVEERESALTEVGNGVGTPADVQRVGVLGRVRDGHVGVLERAVERRGVLDRGCLDHVARALSGQFAATGGADERHEEEETAELGVRAGRVGHPRDRRLERLTDGAVLCRFETRPCAHGASEELLEAEVREVALAVDVPRLGAPVTSSKRASSARSAGVTGTTP